MEFEDILKDIGGFGAYQKMLIAVFMPTFIILPWLGLALLFMTNTPEHWCYVPELANSNLSLDLQKQLIRPPQDASCSMYDINYTEILHSENLILDPSWPTKKCDRGWQYDKTNYDETVVTKWNLVCNDSYYNSLLLSIIFVGCIFGPPVFGFMSDKIGRKRTFFYLLGVVVLSEFASLFNPYFVLFVCITAAIGSVINTLYTCGCVILLELVSPDIRTSIYGLTSTTWTIGLCLLPLVAWLTRDWMRLIIVLCVCAIGLAFYWKLLPESPRWLLSQNRYEEAHAILVKVSKMNGKSAHVDDQLMQKLKLIGKSIKDKKIKEEKHSPLELLKYPNLRRRFFLVTICWIGISNTYYGLQFNVRNLSGNEFLNFFLVSLVEIPSHFAAWILLERIGRRWTMFLGFFISGAACIIPVFACQFAAVPMIDVIASLLAKAGISASFMTIYQQASEVFPTTLRCQGMAISFSIASATSLVMPYMVNLTNTNNSLLFLMFTIISCIAAISSLFLPETLNRNLPQTVDDVEDEDKNFKWCPCSRQKEEEQRPETKKDDQNISVFAISTQNNHPIFNKKILNHTIKDIPTLIKWKPLV